MSSIGHAAGLTLKQNKHVIMASRGKGHPIASGHMAIYAIRQILD